MPNYEYPFLPVSIGSFAKTKVLSDGMEVETMLNLNHIGLCAPAFDAEAEADGWSILLSNGTNLHVTEDTVKLLFSIEDSPVTKNIREAIRLIEKYYEEIEYQINDKPWPHGDEEEAEWIEDRHQVELWLDDVRKVWKLP